MRRIAAVALAAGSMLAGLAVAAAPAEAATSFTSPNGSAYVKATGKYAKNSTKAVVKFTLADGKTDGYAACVLFRFREGTSIHDHKLWLQRTNSAGKWVLWDAKGAKAGTTISDANTTHLYVRECMIRTTTKKTKYGQWKKLY